MPARFTTTELTAVRTSGAILRACLEHVAALVRPGVTTKELDRVAEAFIRGRGGEPAFKGYNGYPSTLCTSVNAEAVHGIPGSRVLREGDIISLDCGVRFEGLCTDACVTVGVGVITPLARRLIAASEQALQAALEQVRAGNRVGDISAAVQAIVEGEGFHVLHALTGHGVGRTIHEPPDVPNIGRAGQGPVLEEGMVLAIEPIIAVGTTEVREAPDGWTIVTADQSLSAHSEHTVVVQSGKCTILA